MSTLLWDFKILPHIQCVCKTLDMQPAPRQWEAWKAFPEMTPSYHNAQLGLPSQFLCPRVSGGTVWSSACWKESPRLLLCVYVCVCPLQGQSALWLFVLSFSLLLRYTHTQMRLYSDIIGGSCEISAGTAFCDELFFHNPVQPKESVSRDSSLGNRSIQHTVSNGPTCRQSSLMDAQEGPKFSAETTSTLCYHRGKTKNVTFIKSSLPAQSVLLFRFFPVFKVKLLWKWSDSITLSPAILKENR